jgi:hypothetical protein
MQRGQSAQKSMVNDMFQYCFDYNAETSRILCHLIFLDFHLSLI